MTLFTLCSDGATLCSSRIGTRVKQVVRLKRFDIELVQWLSANMTSENGVAHYAVRHIVTVPFVVFDNHNDATCFAVWARGTYNFELLDEDMNRQALEYFAAKQESGELRPH